MQRVGFGKGGRDQSTPGIRQRSESTLSTALRLDETCEGDRRKTCHSKQFAKGTMRLLRPTFSENYVLKVVAFFSVGTRAREACTHPPRVKIEAGSMPDLRKGRE